MDMNAALAAAGMKIQIFDDQGAAAADDDLVGGCQARIPKMRTVSNKTNCLSWAEVEVQRSPVFAAPLKAVCIWSCYDTSNLSLRLSACCGKEKEEHHHQL